MSTSLSSLLRRALTRAVASTERRPSARTTEAQSEPDRFAEAFRASRGTIDPDLDLEA
jgi:hypothetical protein